MPDGPPAFAAPGAERDPRVIQRLLPLWDWLYQHYFRVSTSGWERIPSAGPMLLVGSHNGGLASPDLPMLMRDWFRRIGLERRVYGLAHPKVWQVFPQAAQLAARTGAIPYYPRLAAASHGVV